MGRNCKVISAYFGTRRRYPYNSKDAIDVMMNVIEHERTMDPGVDNLDVVLINHDCGDEEGNNYLDSIDGIEVYCGKVRVIHRAHDSGTGVSMTSFDYGFKELRDEYDYWFFQEDDYKVMESGYFGRGIRLLDSDDEVAYIAYDTVEGSLKEIKTGLQVLMHVVFAVTMMTLFGYIKFIPKFCKSLLRVHKMTNEGVPFAEGGMGLTNTRYMSEVIDKFGRMPSCLEVNPPLDEYVIKEYNEGNRYGKKFSWKRFYQVNRYFTWYWLQAVTSEFDFTAVFYDIGYRVELYRKNGGFIYSFKVDDMKVEDSPNDSIGNFRL
jgi:hypothetical protein|tara:strand:- start:52 stop:1011 length:960 start_codon:yes stop_codon:yes gene_type:complete